MELSKHMGCKVMVTTGGTNLRDDILRLYDPGERGWGKLGDVSAHSRVGIYKMSNSHLQITDKVVACD